MTRRFLALAVALLLAALVPGAASGHEVVKSVTLSSSQYTNGTVKSVVVQASHNHCGNVYSDVSMTIYYDLLNTSKIRITKVKVNYYVKGSTSSGVWGGTMWATDKNLNQKQWLPPGNIWGDHTSFYKYNTATRMSDGYSFAGTYTHTGPVTINGRAAFVVKRTNVQNGSVCVGGWDYTLGQLYW
jgi:hypothetical protein